MFALDPNVPWLVFVAQFASIVLTFMATSPCDCAAKDDATPTSPWIDEAAAIT